MDTLQRVTTALRKQDRVKVRVRDSPIKIKHPCVEIISRSRVVLREVAKVYLKVDGVIGALLYLKQIIKRLALFDMSRPHRYA